MISIHAPRVGSDRHNSRDHQSPVHFNPRSPRGERPSLTGSSPFRCNFNPRSPRGERRDTEYWVCLCFKFQSTLPAWGATISAGSTNASCPDFNPRSPRGERHVSSPIASAALIFQSTLPAWGATAKTATRNANTAFQSTLPAWGATLAAFMDSVVLMISIHAPRVGSDSR